MLTILDHPRVARLGATARNIYLELLGASSASGHVAHPDVQRAFDVHAFSRSALQELIDAGLLNEEPGSYETPPTALGWWIVLPQTIDDAEVFARMPKGSGHAD